MCENAPDACAQATRCGAVKLLCTAVRTHASVTEALRLALKALGTLVSQNEYAAAEVAAAGDAGIGMIVLLLLRSTPEQDATVFMNACALVADVVARATAAVSSADAVLPLLHVLNVCSLATPKRARSVCHSLQVIMQTELPGACG